MRFVPKNSGVNPADDPDMLASVVPDYWFDCSTIADVDAHMARQLHDFINTATANVSETRRQQARQDLDNLLDRRYFLEVTAAA